MSNQDWIRCSGQLPPTGVVVETKIDDGKAESRNYQRLLRDGSLWYLADGSMYVYYTPTHWKPIGGATPCRD